MNGLVVVGAAGAAGAVARHLLDVGLRRWFPEGPSVGVLAANVLGAFVLGALTGVLAERTVDPELRLALGVGFCGAFTTFSTFAAQVVEEAELRGRGAALRWVGLMLGAGLVAAALGVAVGRAA